MASICEASASAGSSSSEGSTFSSGSMGSACQASRPSMSEATTWLRRSASSWLWMSFHITNCENEKSPIIPVSRTSQPGWSITLLRNVLSTRRVSTPDSSCGSGSSPLIDMP